MRLFLSVVVLFFVGSVHAQTCIVTFPDSFSIQGTQGPTDMQYYKGESALDWSRILAGLVSSRICTKVVGPNDNNVLSASCIAERWVAQGGDSKGRLIQYLRIKWNGGGTQTVFTSESTTTNDFLRLIEVVSNLRIAGICR